MKLLGDFAVVPQKFNTLSEVLREFQEEEFLLSTELQKNERVNRVLYQLIDNATTPCFLLPAVLDFIEKVHSLRVFESYAFMHFEMWLNQFSHLNDAKNYEVRAKISGKWVPRSEYQIFFPIGMNKVYPGSHFVTAHGSPDIDTTIASFWGWVDAFAARVSEGLHLWNVPEGAPESQVEMRLLFNQIFGDGVFHSLAKTRTSLSISGIELMSQKGCIRKQIHESAQMLDHERNQMAIVIVDKEGYYLGDWRSFDAEGVREVIWMLNNCLRWFEHHLYFRLIAMFAKPKPSLKDVPAFVGEVFAMKLEECEPAKEFTKKQRQYIQDYLVKVLGVKRGLQSTFNEFSEGMKELSLSGFQEFIHLMESLHQSSFFDSNGELVESRPQIFNLLEKVIKGLDRAIQSVRSFVETLDVALNIKTQVFGHLPHYVSHRADLDEIKSKMGNYPYLSVVATDKEGRLLPLGIVHSQDLHRPILGTVTLRDFCNRDETKIPSYLEVISVIDHHKSHLQTSSAPMVIISDAQSSNVLCAEMAFTINDRFGMGGMQRAQIDAQVGEMCKDLSSSQNKRQMKNLLQRQLAGEREKKFFIDPTREFVEYLHFLYGILDDTDLLTKVSLRDVECVVHLINRLKSITLQKETEIISLCDIPRDQFFVQKAAARILQNEDMYSLYCKIYLAKEIAMDENISLCIKGLPSCLFIDTKEQNGCSRGGQTKMFARNFALFGQHVEMIQRQWFENVLDFFRERPVIDLHMQMISTVAGAEDLFAGLAGNYKHKDELWIWIPFTEQSIEHLKSFLSAFGGSLDVKSSEMSVEFVGDRGKDYEQIFKESFVLGIESTNTGKGELSIAVLKYKAGFINSRKAMITPYLPKLVE